MKAIVLVVGLGIALFAGAQSAESIAGYWEGTLQAGAAELRLGIEFKKTDAGLSGSMDSIDQGAMDIPMSAVTLDGKAVTFEIKVIAGMYTGTLNEDGTEIAGTWTQGATSIPLTLKKAAPGAEAATLSRPQEPKPPLPYKAIEVRYPNPSAAGVELAGTLTLPESGDPKCAVVLISGSGPQNRDETVAGHRPFLIIADYLTRQGIAVLRSDDRGVAESKGDFDSATSEDFATDALASVAFLKTRPQIAGAPIGLLGHSEGGLIAPIAAVRSTDIAFIVLLAGPAVPGDEILAEQAARISRVMGMPESVIAENQRTNEQIYAAIKDAADAASAEKALRSMYDALPEAQKQELAAGGFDFDSQLKIINTAWFRNFLSYDPRPTLSKVTCPVLAIFGEFDLQVPADQNSPEMKKALEGGATKDYTIEVVSGVNHLFQTTATGSIVEYSRIEETMTPKTLKLMAEWVVKHGA